ncbi:hypothetical protein R9X49_22050 [Pectobacterium carotovorum]|uniref:hypothetical protein n=1 Tax=Pectobacterium carotovorum TaxID=554 RepID=UPI0029DA460A|nr:hypothetical protein [Pectobacterium carotovorum]MDX6917782.1 hypothetical protein [Pectobacterium carotovorum]
MGMFDTVRFRYRMPDGKMGTDFQTKNLDCTGDFYEITPEGRLLCWLDQSERKDIDFDGMLTLSAGEGYYLHFTQGTLQWIEVYSQGDQRWPFEPARFMSEQP